MRNREEFSFKAYYPFDRLNGYYVTSKQGRLEIYSSVCMLYDAQGRLSNFFLINIDNTEINRAHSRIAEFERLVFAGQSFRQGRILSLRPGFERGVWRAAVVL